MRQILDIRNELNQLLVNGNEIGEGVSRRILLELMFQQTVLLQQINASAGGDPDWRYEKEGALTVSTRILSVKRGDLVMVRLTNWDYDETRAMYYGLDGPVTVETGIPILPGKEKVFMANADLWVISPSRGELVGVTISAGQNDIIPFSEDGFVTIRRAVIAAATYQSGQDLATAYVAALNAASGGPTYTGSFNQLTRKYTATSDGFGGATFGLGFLRKQPDPPPPPAPPDAGHDEAGVCPADLLGFPFADQTGALSYTSPNVAPDHPLRIRVGKARPVKVRDRDYF